MKESFEKFTVSITNISRVIRKIENIEMEAYKLRSAHVECLYYLYVTNVKTAAELVEKCGEDKASVSRTLEFLEKNEFITRDETNKKRYNSCIYLTEKGKCAAEKISLKIADVIQSVSFDFSEEERNNLYACLFRISERLEKIYKSIDEGEKS